VLAAGQVVRAYVATIEARCREAFLLHVVHELSQADIAPPPPGRPRWARKAFPNHVARHGAGVAGGFPRLGGHRYGGACRHHMRTGLVSPCALAVVFAQSSWQKRPDATRRRNAHASKKSGALKSPRGIHVGRDFFSKRKSLALSTCICA